MVLIQPLLLVKALKWFEDSETRVAVNQFM